MSLAFEPYAKWLLFAHLTFAVVAFAIAIHLAIRVFFFLQKRPLKVRHERLYVRLLAIFYFLTYFVGCILYPTFRIRIREEFYVKEKMDWATGLFEVKEHFASFGFVAVIAIIMLSQQIEPPVIKKGDRNLLLYWGVLLVLIALMFFNVWSGWFLAKLRSV